MDSSPMPQGAYRVNENWSGAVVWLNSIQINAHKAVTTLAIAGKQRTEPARLVFHRYGEDYFLAEIWTGNTSVGRVLARSPREKELAQSGAAPHLAMIQISLHR
jgi:hypothetical protein